jgi:hypothetical protein
MRHQGSMMRTVAGKMWHGFAGGATARQARANAVKNNQAASADAA